MKILHFGIISLVPTYLDLAKRPRNQGTSIKTSILSDYFFSSK